LQTFRGEIKPTHSNKKAVKKSQEKGKNLEKCLKTSSEAIFVLGSCDRAS